MTILIPAYKPNQRLIQLIHDLINQCSYDVVVVDDGSGPDYKHIFDAVLALGCKVLTHERNRGKGAALKTGFQFIIKTGENTGVVTADCDGQHLAKDIIKVAEAVKKDKKTFVLGTRRFAGKVPLRIRFGNSITRIVFTFLTGSRLYDTQTGLRGFSVEMLPWLCGISGNRYDYEMNMLMKAVQAGYSFRGIDIETVYFEKNRLSHFRPFRDSFLVYLPIMKFCMSSFISASLDFVLLIIIKLSTKNLLLAVVGARICSAGVNYTINRHFVFSQEKVASMKSSFPRYVTLVIIIMFLNYCVIHLYHNTLGIPLVWAKILTDACLFLVNYWAQRKFVFKE